MDASNLTIAEIRKQRRREKSREYSRKQALKYVKEGSCRACGGQNENEGQHCGKCKRLRTSRRLKSLYGITLEQYEELSAYQEHVCWICGEKETAKDGHLHVDHCHKTGKIRGLLCVRCNSGLGGFRDSPELLEHAIEYLKVFSD